MIWNASDRAFIVELYYKTGSIVNAQRQFRRERHSRTAPSINTIKRLAKQFRERGSVIAPKRRRSRTARTAAIVAKVSDAVTADPKTSSRRLSRQTGVTETTVRRILHQDIGLFPYKIQLVQKLRYGDKKRRLDFCHWLLDKCNSKPDFMDVLFMSDEAQFHLDGKVNKQNCRIWADQPPQIFQEVEGFSPYISVWCAVSSNCIIGPYFFDDKNGPFTVTAPRYCQMVRRYFIPQLRRRHVSLEKTWFQQDGASSHTAKTSIRLLEDKFRTRFISKNGPHLWPPRSPDMTAPDFFLWGFVKSQVYCQPVQSIDDLKKRIKACIRGISTEVLRNAMASLPQRCKQCVQLRGGHLPNVIFKK